MNKDNSTTAPMPPEDAKMITTENDRDYWEDKSRYEFGTNRKARRKAAAMMKERNCDIIKYGLMGRGEND